MSQKPKINSNHFRLMLITQGDTATDIEAEIQAFLEGGGRWVQLRMKNQPIDFIEFMTEKMATLCHSFSATFIINDHPYLAINKNIDGVHLGKNDMSVSEARQLMGPEKIIGATANNLEDIISHINSGANYIGLGPFRFTTTKKNLSPTLGLKGYQSILMHLNNLSKQIPIIAIGGITLADIPLIMETGVGGIAISGAISRATNPQLATVQILKAIDTSTTLIKATHK